MQTATPTVAGTRDVTIATGPITMHRRIGSIVYEVELHFNPDAKETMNDKILRLIRRDMEAAT